MLHDNDSPVVIVYPSRRKIRIVVSIFLGLILLITSVAVYMYSLKSSPLETDITEATSDQAVESASSTAVSVFRLALVPEATSSITLALPVQNEDLKKADRASYDKAKLLLQTEADLESVRIFDNPLMLEVNLVSALRELERSDSAAVLYQVQDELLSLTQYFNLTLQPTTTLARGVADSVSAPYEAAVYTVSPSSHVVLTLFMGDILKKSDLVKTGEVDAAVEAMLVRGVAYGLYATSDVAVSKSLYTQYKTLLMKNYPELSSSF